jgi:succinate dehydrogenase/fumarate reductase flavoprotein subunit
MQDGLAQVAALTEELAATSPAGARQLMHHTELNLSLLVARSSLSAALQRQESRGAHYRSDYPSQDDGQWKCSLAISFDRGELDIARDHSDQAVSDAAAVTT